MTVSVSNLSDDDSTSSLSVEELVKPNSSVIIATQSEDHEVNDKSRMVGAGVTTTVVALMFGPVIAIIVGTGAAYGTTQPGAAGDVCRAIGDLGIFAQRRAREVNEKHNLVDKAKKGSERMLDSLKKADKKHNILKSVGDGLKVAFCRIVKLERDHRVIARCVEFLSDKVNGQKPNTTNESSSNRSKEINMPKEVDTHF